MEMITMILSGLALLAAGVSLILTIQEKKRNEKRNAAALLYTDKAVAASEALVKSQIDTEIRFLHSTISDAEKNVMESTETLISESEERTAYKISGLAEEAKKAVETSEDVKRQIDSISDNLLSDFNKMIAEQNFMDEFNKSLSAIMNFDPMEEARKARERAKYGEAE